MKVATAIFKEEASTETKRLKLYPFLQILIPMLAFLKLFSGPSLKELNKVEAGKEATQQLEHSSSTDGALMSQGAYLFFFNSSLYQCLLLEYAVASKKNFREQSANEINGNNWRPVGR